MIASRSSKCQTRVRYPSGHINLEVSFSPHRVWQPRCSDTLQYKTSVELSGTSVYL